MQTPSTAYDAPGFGVRAGIGTDIGGGIGVGGILNYYFGSQFELNAELFYHTADDTWPSASYSSSTIELVVFGVLANYLVGYTRGEPGAMFIAGFGLAVISYSGTGYSDSWGQEDESATSAGSVVNLGVGYSFGNAELRAEAPIILIFDPKSTGAFVPTFTATVGYRF